MSQLLVYLFFGEVDRSLAERLLLHLQPLRRTGCEVVCNSSTFTARKPVAAVLFDSRAARADRRYQEILRSAQGALKSRGSPVVWVRLDSEATTLPLALRPAAISPPHDPARSFADLPDADEVWAAVTAYLCQLNENPPTATRRRLPQAALTGLLGLVAIAGFAVYWARHSESNLGGSAISLTPTRHSTAPSLSTVTVQGVLQNVPAPAVTPPPPVVTTPAVAIPTALPREPSTTAPAVKQRVPSETPQAFRGMRKNSPGSVAPGMPSAALVDSTIRPPRSGAQPVAPRQGAATCDANGLCQLQGLARDMLQAAETLVCLDAPDTAALGGRMERCQILLEREPLKCSRQDPTTAAVSLKGSILWHLPCPGIR